MCTNSKLAGLDNQLIGIYKTALERMTCAAVYSIELQIQKGQLNMLESDMIVKVGGTIT